MISAEQRRKNLVLHAVLLLRTVNKSQSKEENLREFNEYYTDEQLTDYIEHFHEHFPDPEPERSWGDEEDWDMPFFDFDDCPHTSCTARDYGPSNPWDAPGMSIHDFI